MNLPAQHKYKKVHKINLYKFRLRGSCVRFGQYGIQSLEPKMSELKSLESARKVLMKQVRKMGTKMWVRIASNIPQTSKGKEMKLGKGCGKISKWQAPIRYGTVIFEFNCNSKTEAEKIHRIVSDKLCFKTQLNLKFNYLLNA